MKRFALFSGANYYPGGGWSDFGGTFDTAARAIASMPSGPYKPGWWHVVDLTTGKIVGKS